MSGLTPDEARRAVANLPRLFPPATVASLEQQRASFRERAATEGDDPDRMWCLAIEAISDALASLGLTESEMQALALRLLALWFEPLLDDGGDGRP